MLLFGIAGKARTGKDTAARYLCDQYGLEPLSFAAPIKCAIADLFNLNERHMNGDLKEVSIDGLGRSPRELFQTLGTDWGRRLVHPDVWVYASRADLARRMAVAGATGEGFPGAVWCDIRFGNEAALVRELGGLVLHLRRDDAPQVAEHVSERGVEVLADDVVVDNNGTLGELYGRLLEVVHDYRRRAGQ